MRRFAALGAVVVTLAFLTACSDAAPEATPSAGGSVAPTRSAGIGAGPGATPTSSPLPPLGSATDKGACESITTELTEWMTNFAEAAAGIGEAGSDASKIEAVVKEVKAANSEFAADLRDIAGKTKDARVKDVAGSLAGALDKISAQLVTEKIVKDPAVITTAFDLPEYAAAATAFERVCAGA